MGVLVAGGSIAFNELATAEHGGPSPIYSADRESRGCTRVGVIAYADIDAALLELFPDPPAIPGIHPTVAYLFADKVTEIRPWPDSPDVSEVSCPAGVNVYAYAKLTIQYATLKYDEADLLSRSRTYSVESMPLPDVGLRWAGGDKLELADVQAYKNIPIIEHKITLHRSTGSSDATIRDLGGFVNDGAFEGADDQTLLFTGADESFTISTNGVKSYTKTFTFKERRIKHAGNVYGWNHAWRADAPGGGAWVLIETENGDPLYPKSTDFGNLF
jgi:hypothetical protein